MKNEIEMWQVDIDKGEMTNNNVAFEIVDDAIVVAPAGYERLPYHMVSCLH